LYVNFCVFVLKGYSRKGAALSFLKRYDDAISVYEEGLKLDPNNQQLLNDLETARRDASGPAGGGLNFFSDPQFLTQLMTNPKARELLKDPETAMLVKMMQQQPSNTSYVILWTKFYEFIYSFRLLSNPKIMKLLGTVLGFEVGDENDLNSKMETDTGASSTKKETPTTSKPSTTTTKTTEQNKNLTPEQSQVRNFLSI
jgi:stress-induced-phosphoprotein 1